MTVPEGRVLIVEASADRAALAACRALGAAGWTVGVASTDRAGLVAASRCAAARHRVVPPHRDLEGFIRDVNAAIEAGRYELVFPGGGDAEALALSMRRDELAAQVPYPAHDRFLRASDKVELTAAAERLGLAVPRTVEIDPGTEAELDPPLVVKARLHAPLEAEGGSSRFEAAVVSDLEEARRQAEEIRGLGGAPIAQELIDGRLMALTIVTDRDSRVLARAQQVAELTWPPGAGVSVRARTVAVDEELGRRTAELVAELGWFGLAQLQFVLSPARGPVLVDFNGRFYGSLSLALAAGPNLAAIWAAEATGRPAPPSGDARPRVAYQWLGGDLRRALTERRGGLGRDLAGSLLAGRGAVRPMWSRRDPRPTLRAARLFLGRSVKRIARR